MLLNNEPPMGFGNKCPKLIAYRRLIRMNMPVDSEGKAHFTTTLFALIREALKIKVLSLQGKILKLKNLIKLILIIYVKKTH